MKTSTTVTRNIIADDWFLTVTVADHAGRVTLKSKFGFDKEDAGFKFVGEGLSAVGMKSFVTACMTMVSNSEDYLALALDALAEAIRKQGIA